MRRVQVVILGPMRSAATRPGLRLAIRSASATCGKFERPSPSMSTRPAKALGAAAWGKYVSCVDRVVATGYQGLTSLGKFAKGQHTYFKNWAKLQGKASCHSMPCHPRCMASS